MNQKFISKTLLSIALLVSFAVAIAGQETAQEKEINRLFDSGEIHLWERRFPQAIADFQKVIRLNPQSKGARYYLGRIYLESGEYDKSIAEFERYLEQVPDDKWSLAFIGEAYLKKGDADLAIEYLTEKIAAEDFVGYHETRAEAYRKKNLIDEAIDDYSWAINDYDHPGYLARRAALYSQKGDKKSALKDYLALLENFPDYEKARREALKLGATENDLHTRIQPTNEKPVAAAAALFQNAFEKLMAEGKDAGIYFFGKAAAADPKFATPIYYRGLIYDTQVDYGKAFKEFKKASEVNPKFVEPHLKYADRVLLNGYFEIARSMYERVLEIDPQEARAFKGLGAALIKQSEAFDSASDENSEPEFIAEKMDLQKQAVKNFNKAVELNPKFAEAYFARGETFFGIGKLNEAAADYTAAADYSRQRFIREMAFYQRAYAYCSLGETEKAAADAARDPDTFSSKPCQDWAINQTKKPETAGEWTNRAAQLAVDKNFAAAIGAYDTSLKIEETAEALNGRGRIYLLLENYDAANADFSRAIVLNPNDRKAYKFRAALNQLQNKTKEAIGDFSALIKLAPDNAFNYVNRADLYAKNNQTESALADYEKAVGMKSDYESEFRIRRGDVYLQLKNYPAAIADYDAAVEELPLRISLYPKRAEALCAAGKKAAARADWQTYKKHGGQKTGICQ